VWVEFVEGERVTEASPEVVGGIADLLAVLYKRDPRRLPLAVQGAGFQRARQRPGNARHQA
jgi:hypothetical protein